MLANKHKGIGIARKFRDLFKLKLFSCKLYFKNVLYLKLLIFQTSIFILMCQSRGQCLLKRENYFLCRFLRKGFCYEVDPLSPDLDREWARCQVKGAKTSFHCNVTTPSVNVSKSSTFAFVTPSPSRVHSAWTYAKITGERLVADSIAALTCIYHMQIRGSLWLILPNVSMLQCLNFAT